MNRQAISIESSQPRIFHAFVGLCIAVSVVMGSALQSQARGAPESFADLAEQVSPAVVNITTTTLVEQRDVQQPMIPKGSPFEDFFRDFLDREGGGLGKNGAPKSRRSQALGSGFVISEDGFIVTNNHVIEGADEIIIEFFEGGELPAKVIGTDRNTDIALLKVESDEPLDFVAFGDSDIMRVGDWVLAVGNPLGQGFSVSAGIVSQRNQKLSGAYDDFIQTDAAINRGNSGGPLFNMDGEVIGVNTAILSPNGGSIGIGFSMSSSVVNKVVSQLKEFGETRRGWLGVRIQNVTQDIALALELENTNGAMVTDVPAGPAREAGILANDIIMSFDGQDVKNVDELVRLVGNSDVGKAVRVTVWREGMTETLKINLGRREDAERQASTEVPLAPEVVTPAQSAALGMILGELTDELRNNMGLAPSAHGLVVLELGEETEAFAKGIRPGDLITDLAQEPVTSIDELKARVNSVKDAGRESILLLVRRDDNPRFVALSLQ